MNSPGGAGFLTEPRARVNSSTLDQLLKLSFAKSETTDPDSSPEGDASTPSRPPPSVFAVRTPSKSPSKSRSFSDTTTPRLAPSPKLQEAVRITKDDHVMSTPLRTPRRAEMPSALSLQMPTRDVGGQSSPIGHIIPLSPKMDNRNPFGGAGHILPRNARGMDFARSATNLHHSILAEQSSPDSSPTITQKAMMIPSRKQSMNSMLIDGSCTMGSGLGYGDKSVVSSSLGSVNMLGSEDSESSDDDMDPIDPDDQEDAILSTPQVQRKSALGSGMSGGTYGGTYGGLFPNMMSPAGSSFWSLRRAKLKNGRSGNSSSSASGHSSVASPAPTSPPPGKSNDGGYFAKDASMRAPSSRRESLTLGTNELHISSGNDSGDEATMPASGTPGVIRRPVTRRGNLLVSNSHNKSVLPKLLSNSR
jgi:hypothetical protein